MGGLRALTGYPDRPPTRVGVSIGDSLTGMFGVLGALAALEARHRTGRGQIVDASIYESVLAVTEALVTDWHAEGLSRERTGPTLPGIAPSNVYATNDGQVLIAANQDSVFARLVGVMGQPGLAADARFASHQARAEHVAEIDAIVTAWTLTRSSAEVLARLHEAGVPAGLVYEPKDMLDDPHFAARESLVRVADEKYGEIVMQGVFPRLSATPGRVRRAGPPLGADTDDVLRELLGLDPAEIARLRSDQVI